MTTLARFRPPATRTVPQAQGLHVQEFGRSPGRTLVFIPGLGGTTRYWQGRLGALEQNYHTVLVDPLGFGDSPKPWTRYTIERHVEALHEVLAPHAPFTLVGHSMGTLLSVAYAARYPQEVNALALLSLPCYESKDKALDAVRGSSPLYRVFLGNLALAVLICFLTRRIFAWLIPYFQPDLPREVSADVVKHSWRSFTSSLWEVIYSYDVKQDADQIGDRIPVLCVHGDRDPIAPLASVRRLAGGRSNWQVQVLPGVDHHPLFRTPEVCLRAIQSVVPGEQVGAMP
ncbi:MAG: alpha/beta hydrolase [Anaerolineales bacterium]